MSQKCKHSLAPFIDVCQTTSVSRPLHCFLSCFCLIIIFFPGRCCECEAWSITRDSVFISPPPGVGSGAICLIGPFWLQCCDRASVISPHTAQGVRSLRTFHNGDGKSKMEIWPVAGISGSEFASSTRSRRSGSGRDGEIKCLLQTLSAALSHGPEETTEFLL